MTSLKLDIPCAVIASSVAEGLTAALCAPCLLRVLGSNGMRCGFVKGPERGALGASRRCKGISVSLARFMVIIPFARYCRPTRSRLVSALRRKDTLLFIKRLCSRSSNEHGRRHSVCLRSSQSFLLVAESYFIMAIVAPTPLHSVQNINHILYSYDYFIITYSLSSIYAFGLVIDR